MRLPPLSLASTLQSCLKHTFRTSTDGIYFHTRSDGELYSLSRLKAKTKTREVLIRDMLFADDDALTSHKDVHLQNLMYCFTQACEGFRLTISLRKTNLMSQACEIPPTITINNYQLDLVKEFTYLGSMDSEISRRIGRATPTLARLSRRVCDNDKLTVNTKIIVYRACVLSAFLYGGESWTPYSRQERKLNTFHMRNMRWILGIKWSDRLTNSEVLRRAATPIVYTLLRQRRLRRLRWLGHVRRMQDGRIFKVLLYGDLQQAR